MKRRDFLKTSVVAGAALSLNFEGLQAALSSNTVAVEQAPDLVAVMGGEPEVMLDKALEALGGIGKYIKKGQKVVIKPNIGWDRTPELAGNTNPKLVAEIVKQCLAAGAKEVTVFDHTCDDWQKCYKNSGIEEAAKAAGAKVMPAHLESYYKPVSLPKGVRMKSAKVHEAILNSDVWINVPILKSTSIYNVMNTRKNFSPLPFMFLHRHGICFCQSISARHHGLFSIYPGRNKCRQSTGNFFTLLTHHMKSPDSPFCLAADLPADIPTSETLMLRTVIFPYLIYYILVILYFPA